jgi:hypothetical protein
VALLSQIHLKHQERFLIQNYHVYLTDHFLGFKGRNAVPVRKDIPLNHVDLPPLDSIEATGLFVPIGNSEVLLETIYKPPGKPWSDAYVINLLNLRNKYLLAGDLNAKNPV